ncbi:type II toxin-antitoxin system RelE/ParE family toxin [Riemerella columbina]|uniref:type II toxin-antitoxin system RelE/ParE family toxin n=1 Tax=Riemerella columbina TaxID=103810 RepID=UPI000380B680|nr:type II toxin-antitoxin system RelE/ParE family toxin [Riemerella columbina]
MKESENIRVVILTEEFNDFFSSLNSKIAEKYEYVIHILETQKVVNEKFVKKLENTIFYEMRVSVGNNEHRTIIFSIDAENIIEATQIILLTSFLKKSTKDYKKAIKKAENILNNLQNENND